MNEYVSLTRPHTLIEGENYVCLDGHNISKRLAMTIVKFAAYTSCPAIVVVSNGSGQRVRCPRDMLFVYNRETQVGIPIQEADNGIDRTKDGPH